MNELYIYTTPPDADVSIALDSGVSIDGSDAMSANGRSDAHLVQVPADTKGQGCVLSVMRDGKQPFSNRGLLVPSTTGEAKFQLDDVRLADAPVAPPQPGPTPPGPASNEPESIINEVYASGKFNLATHDGCGEFTEECCKQCHERNNTMWGHIKKNPGQNQYDGHAVDAMQCLAGEYNGIWDIIFDSVSPNAAPAFNHKGPADPALWYYPIDEDTEIRVMKSERPKVKAKPQPQPPRRR